tara:strand:- start:337 stop:516 length:180 start_codon:yes stop_codon:yes gene_type:complete
MNHEEWKEQVDRDRCTSAATAADATTLRKQRMARAVGIYREAATIKLAILRDLQSEANK